MLQEKVHHIDIKLAEKDNKFSVDKFLDNLINVGGKTPCDDSLDGFNCVSENLPPFYNATAFKKGQDFFHRHIFAIFLSKLLGLLTVLSIPSLKILMLTKMSGTNLTAYKRYMSTIFHMIIWYDNDFTPGSKLWDSMKYVKKRHNSASKMGICAGLGAINQRDMAFTQFGFMGYALVRSERIGVFNATDEDWYNFIHVWRVIGSVMGIEDRFNICRESVWETRMICNKLIEVVFRPAVEKKEEDFLKMSSYMVNGMWAMNPVLEHSVFMSFLYLVLNNSTYDKQSKNSYLELSKSGEMKLTLIAYTIKTLRFTISRIYHNLIQYLALWLMKVCPFLAYYKYGKDNSHVNMFS